MSEGVDVQPTSRVAARKKAREAAEAEGATGGATTASKPKSKGGRFGNRNTREKRRGTGVVTLQVCKPANSPFPLPLTFNLPFLRILISNLHTSSYRTCMTKLFFNDPKGPFTLNICLATFLRSRFQSNL